MLSFLEYRHGVTSAGQLLGGGQPGRTGADDGHALASPVGGGLGLHPTLQRTPGR